MIKPVKNSKLIYKGIILDVYQWRQKLYDGSYATFEQAIRRKAADIIAAHDLSLIHI